MKTHTSPVAKFPGEVVLPDSLTFSQFAKWRDAVLSAHEILQNDNSNFGASDAAVIPGILAVVEEWRIANLPKPLTVDNFPATPRRASNALVAWLVKIVSELVNEEEEIPKG